MNLRYFKHIFDTTNTKSFYKLLNYYRSFLVENDIIIVYRDPNNKEYNNVLSHIDGAFESKIYDYKLDNDTVYNMNLSNIDCHVCGVDEVIGGRQNCINSNCDVLKNGKTLPLKLVHIYDEYLYYTHPSIETEDFKVYENNKLYFKGLLLYKDFLKHSYD